MSANSVSNQIIVTIIEKPLGDKNNVNLLYTTSFKFDPNSIKINLSGILLDIEDFKIQPDNKSFEIKLDPDNSNRLNCPPQQFEPFNITYIRC